MSKRERDDGSDAPEHAQKKRKGFTVGPANLPDGTYKRKTQKIKNDLIQKAKVKKAYAKIQAQAEDNEQSAYDPYAAEEATQSAQSDAAHTTLELHPDRQAMLQEPEPPQLPEYQSRRRDRRRKGEGQEEDVNGFRNRSKMNTEQKPSRYRKEFAQAEERKAQIAAKNNARAEREKDRRAMAKARKPGKDGKIKLGRQGNVLLNRVKRMADEGKI